MKKIIFMLLITILTVISCGSKPDNTDKKNEMNKKYTDYWV